MADQLLELTVRVNSETGQLDVVSQKLKGLSEDASRADKSVSGAGEGFSALSKAMGGFLTAAAIGAFFTSAVKGAEEENQALRRLKVSVEAAGKSYETSSGQIQLWAKAIQENTRFTDGQAIETLSRLVRVTGDVTQGQKASQLAMNLSVATGKDLGSTVEILTSLINGNERGVMMARKEFGALISGAENGQQVLDILATKFSDTATKEEGFSRSTASLRNNWDELKDTVGNAVIPVLTVLTGWLNRGIDSVRAMGSLIASQAALFVTIVESIGKAVLAILRRDFGSLADIAKDTGSQIAAISSATVEMVKADFDKTVSANALHNDTRIQQNKKREEEERAAREREKSEEEQAIAALIARVVAAEAKILAIEKKAAADRKIIGVGESKTAQEQVEARIKARRNEAFDAVSTSLEAVAIINNMQSGHTKAQVTRARAILALEKAIAIARIWSTAAGAGPGMVALATAQTALVAAQFAQQSKAIGDAAKVADSGTQELRVSTDLGGGQTLTDISTTGAGGAAVGQSGALSGGGSGGAVSGTGAIINIGPVTVIFQADSVDLQNVDAIARRLGEAVSRGNIEAAQMALAMYRSGQNQEGLAR